MSRIFEEFFNMGGGEMPRQRNKNVDNTTYYKLLGVEKTASTAEIKKAYKKLIPKKHPDKGGDPAEFARINQAYGVLSDPDKKKVYDNYGEEGIKEGMGNQPDMGDFFGGGGGQRREARTKDKGIKMNITLEDCYTGKSKYIEVTRYRICSSCKGNGSNDPTKDTTCHSCNGQGIRVVMRKMGFAVMQSQEPCTDCNGTGDLISPGDRCKDCGGEKVRKETTQLEVVIEKGCPHKKQYKFYEESDEVPEAKPGDVIVEVHIQKHNKFVRKGGDLVYNQDITLLQALTGFSFVLTHLDGRKVKVMTSPEDVIRPGVLKTVYELGMPFHESPFRFGNLYINFNFIFPAALSEAEKGLISQALASQAQNTTEEDCTEKYTMAEFKEEDENTHHQGGKKEAHREQNEEREQHYHHSAQGCPAQ